MAEGRQLFMSSCTVCGSGHTAAVTVAEQMFGMRDKFEYIECLDCGFMRIADVPSDLAKYYPEDSYYSLTTKTIAAHPRSKIAEAIYRARVSDYLFERRGIGWLATAMRRQRMSYLDPTKMIVGCLRFKNLAAKILDVGCGNGALLSRLSSEGFTNLVGVDPFAVSPGACGFTIHRCNLEDLEDRDFDLIMFNHSLEHMEDNVEALSCAGRLLSDNGVIRVEIPVTDCSARADYGVCWIEWDAPRHLCLQSRRSMSITAEKAGLCVIDSTPAGSDFEFWGSEMYRRGYSYFDHHHHRMRKATDLFSSTELDAFRRRSDEAKRVGRSGREIFVLARRQSA